MKVAQLLETEQTEFQDDPLEPDYPPHPIGGYVGTMSNGRREWTLGKTQALRQRDLALFYKLADVMEEYPQDIYLQSFPSEYDEDPEGHYMNAPTNLMDEKLTNTDEFVQIRSEGVFFDEDLATRPHREEDEWDDVYEIFFVRKTKPSLVKYVNNLLQLHRRIEVQLRNSWRWK